MLVVVRRCGPPRPRRTDEVGMRCARLTPGGKTHVVKDELSKIHILVDEKILILNTASYEEVLV